MLYPPPPTIGESPADFDFSGFTLKHWLFLQAQVDAWQLKAQQNARKATFAYTEPEVPYGRLCYEPSHEDFMLENVRQFMLHNHTIEEAREKAKQLWEYTQETIGKKPKVAKWSADCDCPNPTPEPENPHDGFPDCAPYNDVPTERATGFVE